jgi:RNA polymerase sigma factor (TIGR02999 family)
MGAREKNAKRIAIFWLEKAGLVFYDSPPMSEVTRILHAIKHGEGKASDELLPLVYQELRRLAAQKMANEAAGHTLQPTALVHEAWLRLVGDQNQKWDGRGHFFAAAAEAMRRILIENARRKHAGKRGGEYKRVNLEDVEVAILADPDALLLVNEALEKLEHEDPEAAQLVKLRFFAGMTNEEAGQVLGVSTRTAKRCWTFARAWLFRELRRPVGQ